MKNFLILLLLCYFNNSFGQNNSVESFKINPVDFSEYKTSKNIKCQSIQAKILFQSPEMYSFILGD